MLQFLLMYLHIYLVVGYLLQDAEGPTTSVILLRRLQNFIMMSYSVLTWKADAFLLSLLIRHLQTISVFLQNFKEKHRNYLRSHRLFEEYKIPRMYRKNGSLDDYNKWTCILPSLIETSPITSPITYFGTLDLIRIS